jgi:hypothetical protein
VGPGATFHFASQKREGQQRVAFLRAPKRGGRMSTYTYVDKAKKFEIDIVELRDCVRVTLTDKGETTQLTTSKNLNAAFEYVASMFKAGGKPAPLRTDWKEISD